MNRFVRWWKFNLVGAAGMLVQLAMLALLNHWIPGHYLFATLVAVEITLLHNFAWHLHYTWRDRRIGRGQMRMLLRFNFSNGFVSLVGNVVLMRLLVQELRWPVLLSNAVAVLVCSIVNFYLGDSWAFEVAG